jgi:hypothetical protein
MFFNYEAREDLCDDFHAAGVQVGIIRLLLHAQ